MQRRRRRSTEASVQHSDQTPAFSGHNSDLAEDRTLLPAVVKAVEAAGARLRERYSPSSRVGGIDEIMAAMGANDEASTHILREQLGRIRPGAQWDEAEADDGILPPGEWWVVDPVEGNVNHVHGMADWCVSATLVRDNRPVLTAVNVPLADTTYAAVKGGGAYQDGARLQASSKSTLASAIVGTGQAKAHEDGATKRLMTASIAAMLDRALVLRVSVPATLQLLQVAAGRMDLFWQYTRVREGLLAGGLLVAEAGGSISDIAGAPWSLASRDFLATTPALHAAAVAGLASVAEPYAP
jgi:myo-inositol-1(or 4)-monophosphatase